MERIIAKIKELNMQTVLLVLVPVLIGVIGQILLKKGMSEVGQFNMTSISAAIPQFIKAFTNW